MVIQDSITVVNQFKGSSLAERIARIEDALRGTSATLIGMTTNEYGVNQQLIDATVAVKRASAQIDVVMHAAGILYALPRLLDPDEVIESLSLGAGNAGSEFDVVTNRRIAEFKFIFWQGGAESVRKKTLFQDFFRLARLETSKAKYIYLLNTEIPLRFLNGNSKIARILDRNRRLLDDFHARYGTRYQTVGEFYRAHLRTIQLVDLSVVVPELQLMSRVVQMVEETAEEDL